MNTSDYLETFLAAFGYDDLPTDPKVLNRFYRFLNEEYHNFIGQKGYTKLRRFILPFSCVANLDNCVLPWPCARILTIQDRTNQKILDETSLLGLRMEDPGLIQTSAFPLTYVVLNLNAPVARDPSAAAELFVKSTSAADGAGLRAFLSGVVTGGAPRSSDVAMNGVTAVSLGATLTTFINVLEFHLSSNHIGDITLHEGSGIGTELARIPPGHRTARYTRILLHPTPSVAVSYYADVELAINDLKNGSDEPWIPLDYRPLLTARVAMREWEKREKVVSYGTAKARARDIESNLKVFLAQKGGLPGDQPARFSQLGPYFQSGT